MTYQVTVYLLKDMDPIKVCEVTDIPPYKVREVFDNMYSAWCASVLEYTIYVQAFKEVCNKNENKKI